MEPGTAMPNLGVGPAIARDMAAYTPSGKPKSSAAVDSGRLVLLERRTAARRGRLRLALELPSPGQSSSQSITQS